MTDESWEVRCARCGRWMDVTEEHERDLCSVCSGVKPDAPVWFKED